MFGVDRRIVEAFRLVVLLFDDVIASLEGMHGVTLPPSAPSLFGRDSDVPADLGDVLVWLRWLGKRVEALGLVKRRPESRYDP